MRTAIDIYVSSEEATKEVFNTYVIKRNGNFFFKKYSIYIKSNNSVPLYSSNKEDCMVMLRQLIAAGLNGINLYKDAMLIDTALDSIQKK